MKKTLTTLGLAASLAISGAPKANAQIDKNSNETQHKIENVFNQQKNENSNDTIQFNDAKMIEDTVNIQKIKELLEDSEFFNRFVNDKYVKELLEKERLTKEETEKIIEDTLANDIAIGKVKEILEDKCVNQTIDEGKIDELKQEINKLKEEKEDDEISYFLRLGCIVGLAAAGVFFGKAKN